MSGFHVVTTDVNPDNNKRGFHKHSTATEFTIDHASVLTIFEGEEVLAAYAPGTWQRILSAGWRER